MRVGIGEAVASVMVDKEGMAIIFVGVGYVCMVIATLVPTRPWSTIWVGEPALLGRLHAERVITSERDINRYLSVFNFSFMIINFMRQLNHRQNTPQLHPSAGECLSPLLGGYPDTTKFISCNLTDLFHPPFLFSSVSTENKKRLRKRQRER